MSPSDVRQAIASGQTALGIELGSTRIKAVLIGPDHAPIASGSHAWENRYENGVWTYPIEEVWTGVQESFRALADDVRAKYQLPLKTVGALGLSAMMHGYLAFDKNGKLLVPFRTWRNTITAQAAGDLTRLFQFNIPQRWSIAHLYQAILNQEPHVRDITFQTTLAGYVHWRLTGQKVLGVGEASGMFPVDSATNTYHAGMLKSLSSELQGRKLPWQLEAILPKVLMAGEPAGILTPEGAMLLDPTGQLAAGVRLCPPEGDAGTGMVATNSVAERTGNVSAGTSVFAMIVLEKPLGRLYPEIDMVTTPTGRPVAMVHSNNCTSDLNAWVALFKELALALGVETSEAKLFEILYGRGLAGEADAGGLLAYNYVSGRASHRHGRRPTALRPHPGKPVHPRQFHARTPALGAGCAEDRAGHLRRGRGKDRPGAGTWWVLQDRGRGTKDHGRGHERARLGDGDRGRGGAWGMALLAAYMLHKRADEALEAYLATKVFAGQVGTTVTPDPVDSAGFATFMERYRRGLAIEKAAISHLRA